MSTAAARLWASFSRRTSRAPDDAPASVDELRIVVTTAPPSLNNSFHNVPGVGRVKSKRYRQWIKDAGWEIRAQRAAPVKGPVFVLFELGERGSRGDADNLIKAMLDLLVSLQLIEADSKRCVRGYAVRWIPAARDFRIAVVADD